MRQTYVLVLSCFVSLSLLCAARVDRIDWHLILFHQTTKNNPPLHSTTRNAHTHTYLSHTLPPSPMQGLAGFGTYAYDMQHWCHRVGYTLIHLTPLPPPLVLLSASSNVSKGVLFTTFVFSLFAQSTRRTDLFTLDLSKVAEGQVNISISTHTSTRRHRGKERRGDENRDKQK